MNSNFRAKTLQDAIREVIRRQASLQGRTTKSLGEAMGLSEPITKAMLKGDRHISWWHIGVLTKELNIEWSITGEVRDPDRLPGKVDEDFEIQDYLGRTVRRVSTRTTAPTDPNLPSDQRVHPVQDGPESQLQSRDRSSIDPVRADPSPYLPGSGYSKFPSSRA